MILKVLGKGCKNCLLLAERAQQAALELNLEVEIVKVTDMDAILDHGVMRTPALIMNETLLVEGRVPRVEEIKGWLK